MQHILVEPTNNPDMILVPFIAELLVESGKIVKDETLSTEHVTRYRLQESQKD